MLFFIENIIARVAFRILVRIDKFYSRRNLFKQLSKKSIQVDSSALFGKNTSFFIKDQIKEFIIKRNFHCRNNCNFLVYPGASLKINENVFLNNGCSINCLYNIEIGANTIFGEGVKIYDHNHLYRCGKENVLVVERNNYSTAEIRIGENCWIGSNVTILKGVTIGDNVIIGANCLIYKSIPGNSVVKSKVELTIESL